MEEEETLSSDAEFNSAASDMNMLKGVMTIIYIIVFVIGTPGNLWIIYKLVRAK